ncbi:hypothetical protein GobsT_41230 [Gemmata obscuriglobus]|uniref:DUF58 domain-containing protein n=1 Tax=Gemmata obscuriglobus TaxID=114 RepID=A0A2Z3H0K1_9BACT|nr:DUF58 domain-containing protein [Gemmata obscuriglobus]AWM37842.1 DUF58 domain-containing protein [Gemmata obscuriglobus]QEG29327.1 hypothetical protein GobsT_41230 [Gemmata obscuriglobus]VTS08327.1 Uncharacterized protein OS=Isosphaera pallida (strain ATCC 43644 / DSM 9630 / IS1B) GN=Isop_3568 PE=4 SV=1: DUF58 [Gemmata obscuriglobus UQM 2246]
MDGQLDTADHLTARQFVIAVKKLADALNYGTDRSPFLGSGIEYAQSRQYQPGDPVRSIDWRITARMGKVFVKEYEAPKQLPCYLLLDTSASMTVSSVKRSKYAVAVHIAGALAFACLDRVSPVGVLGVGGRDVRLEPSLSRAAVLRWLHEFRRYRYDEHTTLGRRVAELAPTLPNRCLVVALSDLHDPTAVPALKLMAQRHDVIVIQLQDPAEEGVPGTGFLRAGEAETGRVFVTRGSRRWVDAERTARQLKRAGVDHLLVRTDQPFVADLRNFLIGRNVLGRGRR